MQDFYRQANMLIGFFILLSALVTACSSFELTPGNRDNRTLPCNIRKKGLLTIFDCSGRGLKQVPLPIKYSADFLELILSRNHIGSVSKASFQHWYNLTKIDLHLNHKTKRENVDMCKRGPKIEDGTFSKLSKLKQLYIHSDYLCKVPTGLPKNLYELNLEKNNIFSIGRESFSELIQLKKLHLGYNCYYGNGCDSVFEIQDGTFDKLQELTILSLCFNNLTRVPRDLPSSLKELYINNNKITVIGRDDFKNLVNLSVLNLNANCPWCYNTYYPCVPCIGYSSIEIDLYAFQYLTNLRELNLASNSLKSIPSKWFENTTNLQVLSLQFNFLAKEMASAEFLLKLPFLQVLDLSFNYELLSYPRNINISNNFSKLVSLKELYIKGYIFQKISQYNMAPLTKLTKLNILNFGVNFVTHVDFKVFELFPNLTALYLSENKISPISENVNPGRFLESNPNKYVLYENSEQRSTISMSSRLLPHCIARGKAVDLSLNSIFFIDPEAFRSFGDVSCLNLSFNGIGQNLNGTEFIYLKNLKYLDLSNNKLDFASVNAFQELPQLEILDLSFNKHYFVISGVTHQLTFIENLHKLRILNLNWNEIATLTEAEIKSCSLQKLMFAGNRLDILWKNGDSRYLNIFKNFSSLTLLDISHNKLHTISDEVLSKLPQSLNKLFLNDNDLTFFEWKNLRHFKNLKLLNLNNNRLTTITGNLSGYTQSLKSLQLSNNKIFTLPVAFLYQVRSLTFLDLSDNSIEKVNKTIFLSGKELFLEVLNLKGNPFDCTCEIIDFIMWIFENNVTIPRLATNVLCATPSDRKGSGLVFFDLHACSLDKISMLLFFLTFFLVIIVTTLPVIKHLFYWDFWYIYHLFVAHFKRRKTYSPATLYEAYVSYDNKDRAVSDWIFNELCYHLEHKGEHIHLCLEERDWEPGRAVIDNIVQSINESKNTLFVLTKSYVKTGKFKTAFYLALQKLMDENMDVIIIVLLEPVLQNSQYLKLRKKLCKSSILEWPKNPHAEGIFWQKMRNVLLTENCSRYNHFYTDAVLI
ncbi:toll-like receptor 8 [Spea bombifrons]|uniref:toll-like receptor 8 n=1 Tax=Spea bombifrons TaxID=233779 RepID=UPI00234AE5CA|nr:toll-like receptor 8 [Spea bombifrons]